jgi:7,8-dihydropterin-6-yl-methyl-4-(beta-D-ribofuranosyl)aminobenzene 5'-phosphate synthase
MQFIKSILILIAASNILFAQKSEKVTLTVLFDNTTLNEYCTPEWGFACLLENDKERLLFDTGLKAGILLENMKAFGCDPGNIDKIVLSHMHNDHTGGILEIVKKNPNVDVYVVDSADKAELEEWQVNKNKLHKVKDFTKIISNVYSLGEMPGRANEQAIIIKAKNGIYIITGCAHPGIINIIKEAKKHFSDQPIKLVAGGFHLLREDNEAIKQIIQQFKELGVEKAGPTHCTGDQVIQKFAKEYGENFVKLGVGFTKTVEVN